MGEFKMNPRTIINNRRDTKSRLHASVQIITYMKRDRQLALDKIKLLEQTCENLKTVIVDKKES